MSDLKYVIGMDCGTTNIKAVVLGNDGVVAAKASRPNTFYQPGPGMQEQDPGEWWKSASGIFRSLVDSLGQEEAQNICGICISSHTVSLLAVDADGNPVRPAMTYQDSRSSGELKEIVNSIGREEFINIVGGQPSVAFLPNKLLWFRKNEPDLFSKTSFFLQASSYINFKLTGVMVSDIDQGLRTQCMDIATLDWSDKIGQVIGVDLHKMMPPITDINKIIGQVTARASAETGLKEGIPVLAGCSDAMASVYATGMSALGEAGESSGTTSLVFAGSSTRSRADEPVVTRPCSIEGMPWIYDAPIQSSGASVKWFIDKFAHEERECAAANGIDIYEYLNQQALKAAPGSGGIIFFPYLLGERAPLWNDHASGMFIGLRMNMDRTDLIRSVFEGTAFALRHVMETVKNSGAQANVLRICGGGAKSRTWNMIKASVLNMPVYVMSSDSGDVPVGDALIAGNAVGLFPDLAKAGKEILKVEEVIEPIPEWAEVYDKLYPYYVSMYRDLDKDLESLQNTLKELS